MRGELVRLEQVKIVGIGGEPGVRGDDAAGRDGVFVGRIREDASHARGVDLWIVADNVRKGAATNSVQIAEILVNQFM